MSRSWRAAFVGAVVISLASGVRAQNTLGCETGGAGGLIPTAGTGGGGTYPGTLPPSELVSVINVTSVPAGATAVTEIKLFGLAHTWAGDVMATLEDPAGNVTLLFNQMGGSCDFSGDYQVQGLGTNAFPACAGTLTPGSFAQQFNGWPSGTNNIFNTDISTIAPQTGNWTLRVYDWVSADSGSLASWDVCFGTPPPPPPPPPTPCNGTDLTTTYASNNGGSQGGQIFFDVDVTNAAGINVSQFDINTDEVAGTNFTLSVYTIPTTYVGNHANVGAWTLAAQGPGVAAGLNAPSLVEIPDFVLPQGTWGISLVLDAAASHRYTNGTGSNQIYTNSDLTLTAGAALNVPWTGTPFTPRVFNGTLRYNCSGGAPTAYCTAGTTSSGCVPAISADNHPSVSAANPCNITVASVEGSKTGLIFYGTDNTGFSPNPWGVGGNSFLCVKAPTQRTTAQATGGNAGQCDGQLVLDWNAWQATHPSALGQPWSVGDDAFVQGWFRDPAAVKTTNLSDALELVYQP